MSQNEFVTMLQSWSPVQLSPNRIAVPKEKKKLKEKEKRAQHFRSDVLNTKAADDLINIRRRLSQTNPRRLENFFLFGAK